MQKINIFRRIFALLLVTCTAMTYMPGYTFAAEDKAPDPVVTVFDVTGSGDGNAVTVTDGDGEETTVKSDAKVKGDDLTVDFEVSDGSAMKITVKNAEIKKANGLKNEGNAFTADQSKGSFTVIPEEGAQVSVEFTEQEPAEEAPKAEAENDGEGDKETASDDDEESDPEKATEAEEKTEESKTQTSTEETAPAANEAPAAADAQQESAAPAAAPKKAASAPLKSAPESDKEYEDGDSVKYRTKTVANGAVIFKTKDGLTGYCIEPGKKEYTGDDYREAEVDTVSNNSNLAKVMYYIVQKKWDEKGDSEVDNVSGYYWPIVRHVLAQLGASNGSSSDPTIPKEEASAGPGKVRAYYNDAIKVKVPDDFRVFKIKDKDYQDAAVFYKYEEKPAKVKVHKVSTVANCPYSLAGAVYEVYTNSACTTEAKNFDGKDFSLTTDASGNTPTVELKPGTYYVKEKTAPPNFAIDTKVYPLTLKDGESKTVESKDAPTEHAIALVKTAANTGTNFRSVAPNNYSLAGAVYNVYTDRACTTLAKNTSGNTITLTTKADGTTDAVKVWTTGTYYVKEMTASKGFLFDETNPRAVTVAATNTPSNPAKVTSVEPPTYNYPSFMLVKIDDDGNYGWKKLVGTEYTLSYYNVDPSTTNVSSLTPTRSWVFAAKKTPIEGSSGFQAAIDMANDEPVSGDPFYMENGKRVLPIGVFTIKETKSNPGLATNPKVYYGKVYQPSNGAAAKVAYEDDEALKAEYSLSDEEQHPVIKIKKTDSETEDGKPQGTDRENVKPSLAGAVYDVYFDDPTQAAPVKVGSITTDENGEGELATDENGEELTLGTYFIQETKASPGYTIDALYYEDHPDKNFQDGQHIVVARASDADAETMEVTVKSLEGEHHTYVSKKDIATGEELPGAKLQVLDSTGELIEEWTSTTEPHDIVGLHDETQGELKDGTYTLREITAPYGYDTAEDVEFKVTSGQIENTVEMKNAPIKIRTTATDVETGTHMGTFSSEEKIKDVVKFENLYAGRTYTFRGTLMDKKTGEALVGSDGQPITAEKEYTPSGEAGTLVSGEVEIEFTVDASEFTKEKSVVAFEYIDREGRELQMHADLEDEDQTIRYGGIAATTAVDPESKSHNVLAAENTTVVDTVEYSNLAVGDTFVLKGELFDQTTGELTGITAEKTFKPETSEGTIDVEFTFDASEMKNHTLVAFEKLYVIGKDEEGNDKEVELDKHEDPEDEAQTVHIPEVRTHAVDSETEEHISMADEEIVIHDRVTYSNVVPGKEYTIQGKLVFKDTGNDVIVDGQVVTAEKTFTAEKADGEEIIEFKFKGLGLAGKKVVAFENFLEEKRPIAIHADLNDEEQTVNIPKIRTTALDSKTQDHVASADEVITIVDTVKYENLLPGKSYTMKGTLMSKTTGQPIQMNGANVTAEKVFTADKENGEVKLEFKVSSSAYKGDSTVAFEECYFNGKIVAIHKDLNDKEQTVDIPSIGTNATDSDTGDHIANGDEKVTIVDRVEYKNLTPGKEYIVVGILVDKKTGKTATVDGEKLQEQTTFTPSSPNGSVNVTFKFDGTDLRGHKLVAFEYLYYKNVLVATHANINDEDQSVTIPKIATKVGRKSGSYVIDTVEYKGLIPGKEYVMKGYFVTKSDGNRVSGSDGEYTFVPDSPNGKVEVKLDPRNVRSAMVAFESCYLVTDDDEEKLVGEHKDLSDEDQTYRPTPKTGDNSNFILFAGVFLLSAALYLIMRLRRRAAAVRK